MSERFAIASGNANNPAIWNGGSLPTVLDDVHANGFTVTINANVSWSSARTLPGVTAVGGGVFILTDGKTIRADCIGGTTVCLTYTGTLGATAYIIGNCTGGTVGGAYGALSDGDGILRIDGAAIGSSVANVAGVVGNGTSPVIVAKARMGATGTWPFSSRVTFSNPSGAAFEVVDPSFATKILTSSILGIPLSRMVQ